MLPSVDSASKVGPSHLKRDANILLGSRKKALVSPHVLCAGRTSLCADKALSGPQTPLCRPKSASKDA
jgi:hypothetical protein